MNKLISLPLPAILIQSNMDKLSKSLNGEKGGYTFPGEEKHGKRYKQVIANSLKNRRKRAVGVGF